LTDDYSNTRENIKNLQYKRKPEYWKTQNPAHKQKKETITTTTTKSAKEVSLAM
jgi:hypothetical protein